MNNKDYELQLKDFIPFFGQERYVDRTLKYKFTQILSNKPGLEEICSKVSLNEKRLKGYNSLLLLAILYSCIEVGIYYLTN